MQLATGPLRFGVVGVGHLGSIHAKLLNGIEGVRLIGVHDLDAARAATVADELGTSAFGSLDELLDACTIISIVTPTTEHATVALRAINRGIHVFIEKPITSTSPQARELLARARDRGVRLGVGHIERFNPVFSALDGVEIRPLFIEAHRLAQFRPRATDVAVVLDLMIHDIDLVLTLVDSPVAEIRSSGVSIVSDELDIANTRIEFANGCVANLTASRISQRPMRKMRIFQSDAYISVDFAEPAVEIFRIAEKGANTQSRGGQATGQTATTLLGEIERGTKLTDIVYVRPQIPPANALENELRDFVDAVRKGREPRVTGEAAAEALRVAEVVIDEIRSRATVVASNR